MEISEVKSDDSLEPWSKPGLQLRTARDAVKGLIATASGEYDRLYARWQDLQRRAHDVSEAEGHERAILWGQLDRLSQRRLGLHEALEVMWPNDPS